MFLEHTTTTDNIVHWFVAVWKAVCVCVLSVLLWDIVQPDCCCFWTRHCGAVLLCLLVGCWADCQGATPSYWWGPVSEYL